MSFQASKTLRLRRFSAGVDDGYGNMSAGYSEPVQTLALAWWVGQSTDATQGGHENLSQSDASAFLPVSEGVSERDQVELPGYGWFEVDGLPEDHNQGPWWQPGFVQVNLKRVTG